MNFRVALEKYLTRSQLEAIGATKIGIAGAGGLGSNCAASLVRSGFRKFRIVDYDLVEPANLNRQFFFADQVGMAKVEALAQNLLRIEPHLELELFQQRITPQNASDWFRDCDAVLECVDLPETKKLLIETYAPTGKLVVAVSGIAGWGDSGELKIRRLSNHFYLVGDEQNGIDVLPPLAPKVAAAAAMQADLVLAWVLKKLPER